MVSPLHKKSQWLHRYAKNGPTFIFKNKGLGSKQKSRLDHKKDNLKERKSMVPPFFKKSVILPFSRNSMVSTYIKKVPSLHSTVSPLY